MENQTDEAKEPINNEGNQQAEQKQNPILLTTIGRVTTNTPAVFASCKSSGLR